jgi:hypothetical protein
MTRRWHLVAVLCFSMPVVGALSIARTSGVGLGAHVLLFAVGAGLGFACAAVLQYVGTQVRQQAAQRQAYSAILLNVGAVVWIGIALCLGIWLSSIVTRHVG